MNNSEYYNMVYIRKIIKINSIYIYIHTYDTINKLKKKINFFDLFICILYNMFNDFAFNCFIGIFNSYTIIFYNNNEDVINL